MRIGPIDTTQKVFIIAEIGNNHEGDFGLAQDMVRAAAAAGADAVKFQTINPVELVSASQTARVAQLEKFRFTYDQFGQLAELAGSCGALFMSTPFDLDAVTFLDGLVPAFKIASGDNDFFPLLRAVAETGKPVIMSAGLMELAEVERSRDFIRGVWQEKGISQELAILHCVSCYPTPEEDANLLAIRALEGLGVVPGYSDHTLGIAAAVASVAVGARIIEKHFTVDKNYSDFDDHQLSADPDDLKELVRQVREVEALLGRPGKGMSGCEKSSKAPNRRSIVAKAPLAAGTVLGLEHLSWVRPGGGLAPGREAEVLGKRLTRALAHGEMIQPDDLD
jgi:sialic acid synthase SpsE